jgi:type 1 glutamine amidotransferase
VRRFLPIIGLVILFCLVVRARADATPPRKLSVLIVDGMNNHDWARNTRILKTILERSGLFTVDVCTSPTNDATSEEWDQWRPAFTKYDVVVNNFNGGYKATDRQWPAAVERDLEDYVSNGGGLVSYHAANNAFRNWPAYNEMIGLGWRDANFGASLIVDKDEKLVVIPPGKGNKPGHPVEHDFQITLLNADHPITRGMPKVWMHPHEQLTHGQHGPAKNMTVLTYAWAADTKENEVMDWVVPYGKGRVYTTMLGHLWKNGPDTALRCIGFQTLFIRGVEWAATGRVTYPIPKDFPTANEIRMTPVLEAPATTSPAP